MCHTAHLRQPKGPLCARAVGSRATCATGHRWRTLYGIESEGRVACARDAVKFVLGVPEP